MENASLIMTIVRKGWGSTVLAAAVAAGARGSTVLVGRGAGINEQEKIFGLSIEPEKEIVLTVVDAGRVDAILDAIVDAAELNDVGRGIAFVMPVDKMVGVTRFINPKAGGTSSA
jgi:nitrogen regulatory protein PII